MRKHQTCILFLMILMVSLTAFASENAAAAHQTSPTWHFIFPVVNFCLLLGLLWFFFGKQIRTLFNDRSHTIHETVEQAKKLHDKTRWHLEEMKTRLSLVHKESNKLIHDVEKQAHLEQEALLLQAQEMTRRFHEDAKRIAEHEVVRAREELKAQALTLSAKLATQQIKKQMTPERLRDLNADFVTALEKTNA